MCENAIVAGGRVTSVNVSLFGSIMVGSDDSSVSVRNCEDNGAMKCHLDTLTM